MLLARESLDAGLLFLALMNLVVPALAAWNVKRPYQLRFDDRAEWALFGLGFASSGMIAALAVPLGGSLDLVMIAFGVSVFALRHFLPRLTLTGACETALAPFTFLIATLWSFALVGELGFPHWFKLLMLFGSLAGMVGLGFSMAGRFARQSLLTHREWQRPTAPLPMRSAGRLPKVSVQLACYAEPPEVVIATIDHLARLDYPNYEVMVCDNNTPDEALWRPLEAHCARLNRELGFERFRFFHVAPLAGAKAGALNWCLPRMAPDAEVIAVIDADYFAEPDFLARLVGYFDDPKFAYVQTPHDYRGYAGSPYLNACYWEYMPSNKVDMPGVSQYGAGFTIGTMCLIRTEALKRAGGWAEWCLTEDSEVSVRIRALGYHGLYLRQTFGRGLIPETFEDYKKQRFRWTAGPVQQLCRYWRLYLPKPFAAPSNLKPWCKLLEFQRSLAPLAGAVTQIMAVFTSIFLAVMTASGALPALVLPDIGWAVLLLGLASGLVRIWHRYRLTGTRRLRDMLGGELARLSLTYVAAVASFAGLSRKPLAWRRTPKFKAENAGLTALYKCLPETMVGLFHLVPAWFILVRWDGIGAHLGLVSLAMVLFSALRFFAAPVMAVLSEKHLYRINLPYAEGGLAPGSLKA